MDTGLPLSKGRFKGQVEKGGVQGVSYDFGEEGNERSGGEEGGERRGEKGFEYVFHALGASECGFEEAIVQGTVYCHHFPFYFFSVVRRGRPIIMILSGNLKGAIESLSAESVRERSNGCEMRGSPCDKNRRSRGIQGERGGREIQS